MNHVHEFLTHPEGPKQIAVLNFSGCQKFTAIAIHIDLGAGNDIGRVEGALETLCQALVHPQGPKHLTSFSVGG